MINIMLILCFANSIIPELRQVFQTETAHPGVGNNHTHWECTPMFTLTSRLLIFRGHEDTWVLCLLVHMLLLATYPIFGLSVCISNYIVTRLKIAMF